MIGKARHLPEQPAELSENIVRSYEINRTGTNGTFRWSYIKMLTCNASDSELVSNLVRFCNKSLSLGKEN